MIFSKRALLALPLAAATFDCLAVDDYTKTVTRVGAQQSNGGYFYVNEPWSVACLNNVMYIDLTTTAGRAMLATVLQAKATGVTIHWVNYVRNADNTCTAQLIELN